MKDERNWNRWLDPLLFTGSPVNVWSFIPNWRKLEGRNEIQYVLDLRAKLDTLSRFSWENLLQAQECWQLLYNRGARLRKISLGDKVLLFSQSCFSPLSGDIAILLLRGEPGLSLSPGRYRFLLPLSPCCWNWTIQTFRKNYRNARNGSILEWKSSSSKESSCLLFHAKMQINLLRWHLLGA